MPAAGGATTQLLPRLLFLPFFFLFYPISLGINFIQNMLWEGGRERERGKKQKKEDCSLADRQKQVQAGLLEHFDPKWSLVNLRAWSQLRDTNASPDKTWVCLWEDIGLRPRFKWKLLRKSQMVTYSCTSTVGSTKTKPGTLLILTPLVCVRTVYQWVPTKQGCNQYSMFCATGCWPACHSVNHQCLLRSSKQKKKSKPSSVFTGIVCNSRIYWPRRWNTPERNAFPTMSSVLSPRKE